MVENAESKFFFDSLQNQYFEAFPGWHLYFDAAPDTCAGQAATVDELG